MAASAKRCKIKSRVNGDGGINNGFQFRSRILPDHDICGYQVDNNLETPWLARLYDEYGRHTLAWRGERAVFDHDGHRAVTKIPAAEGAPWFRLQDWHEYHLVCVGPTITLRIDGRMAAEVQVNSACPENFRRCSSFKNFKKSRVEAPLWTLQPIPNLARPKEISAAAPTFDTFLCFRQEVREVRPRSRD